MAINPTATLTFTDYTVTDDGIALHFVSPNPGAGQASDYTILLTDSELATTQTNAQLLALVKAKLNRKLIAADIATRLDGLIGQTTALDSSGGTDPAPVVSEPGRMLVTPWSAQALGTELAALAVAAPASTAWATANLARGIPFVVPKPIKVLKMFWHNGATANGNVDAGIYDAVGNRIASTGSVAQTGTSVLQEAAVTTPVTFGPGRFVMVLASSSTTATFFAAAPSVQLLKALGCVQAASAFALPASLTPAAYAAAILPYFGFSARNLVV